MEVSMLRIRLELLLLLAQLHLHDTQGSYFARIVPSTLQLFEYKPISFDCEGFNATTGLIIMRNRAGTISECVSTWKEKTSSVCAIKPAYPSDSGEYWCEAGDERSNTVNISITVGDVILESPAVPVMEGETVTLRCRSKKTSSAHIADFYKDGLPIGSGSTGETTIRSVSKADEGLYKCSISDFGESAESWLAVRALAAVHRRGETPSDHSCHAYLVLRTVFTVAMVALLLPLVGLLHCGKLRVTHKYVCICDVCKGSCKSDGNKNQEKQTSDKQR